MTIRNYYFNIYYKKLFSWITFIMFILSTYGWLVYSNITFPKNAVSALSHLPYNESDMIFFSSNTAFWIFIMTLYIQTVMYNIYITNLAKKKIHGISIIPDNSIRTEISAIPIIIYICITMYLSFFGLISIVTVLYTLMGINFMLLYIIPFIYLFFHLHQLHILSIFNKRQDVL